MHSLQPIKSSGLCKVKHEAECQTSYSELLPQPRKEWGFGGAQRRGSFWRSGTWWRTVSHPLVCLNEWSLGLQDTMAPEDKPPLKQLPWMFKYLAQWILYLKGSMDVSCHHTGLPISYTFQDLYLLATWTAQSYKQEIQILLYLKLDK